MEKNKKELKENKKTITKTNEKKQSSSNKKVEVKTTENDKNGTMFLVILFALLCILVLFLPKIYDYIQSFSLPKVTGVETKTEEEEKVINEEILESIHYPVMRNSIYDINTYYTLEKFTVADMSNNDILYNAFLDIYEGNMTAFESTGYCTNISKQFNQDYIELRIKNILGKKVNYTLEDFYVPEGAETSYVGTWSYDSYNSRFIYNGLCQSNATNIKYYNLENLIKMEYQDDDIVAYYYVGFAKVEGNNYIIYKDAKMTEELKTGTINDVSELNTLFENINNENKNIYKYTFKNTLCSYNEYCLYEGEWVNEF